MQTNPFSCHCYTGGWETHPTVKKLLNPSVAITVITALYIGRGRGTEVAQPHFIGKEVNQSYLDLWLTPDR